MPSAMPVRFFGANLRPATMRVFDAAPLPQCSSGECGRWLLRIAVGRLEAGEMLVPSLTIADGEPYGFRFVLETNGACTALPGFGDFAAGGEASTGSRVATHVDYFSARASIEDAVLVLEVESGKPPHQRPALLGISRRPVRMDPARREPLTTPVLDVPVLSQRDAPADVAMRLCSPACVAMVMRSLGVAAELAEVSRDAYDAGSGLYGVWPQNLHAASRARLIGAVRTFESLEPAAEIIRRGLPVVASLRYAKGELEGAAVEATQGHLVVVCGFEGERAIVNDPAMARPEEVRRSYDLDEFGRIWLRERGAGYVIAPM